MSTELALDYALTAMEHQQEQIESLARQVRVLSAAVRDLASQQAQDE